MELTKQGCVQWFVVCDQCAAVCGVLFSVQRFAVCDQCGVINRQRGHHLHGADEARLHSRPEAGPQRPRLGAPGY